MENVLKYAISKNCSDVHIMQDKIAVIREKGEIIRPISGNVPFEEITNFVEKHIPSVVGKYNAMLNFTSIHDNEEINAAFNFENRRFRVNIFRSIGGITLALRLLSDNIPRLDELNLPESVCDFTTAKKGLVLVCGMTGSGKTTTNTAIIDHINHTMPVNIITNEDPIEYVLKSDKANVIQREVGTHSESFDACTENALRQDPDILVVGELRQEDTIKNALTLAETGHLVFGTVHTISAVECVDRLVDKFGANEKEQARFQIANVLRGAIHQTLVRNEKGRQIPLVEVLVTDDTIRGMIRAKQAPNAIKDYMRGKKEVGCVHIADNAVWHIQNNRLTVNDVKNALSVEDFNLVNAILSHTSKRGGGY